jgi:hypothetical protein
MATEIQRILIKYEADIKQLKTQLDTIQGELKDTEKVSDKSTKEVQRDFEKTAKSAGGVTNALKSVGAAIAAAYSVREIIQFTKESVRLADVQLKAEAQLLTALKGRKEAQQELIKQAADLQKKTTFGDEETIAAQARIAAFVQEVDQIKELTRVSQDFASAKGIDLATASDLITKSFASSTNALSRYGIEIEGTAGSSERLTNIVKGLDNAFKGQAEVIARTGLGPLIQLQNAFGDLQESIGKLILSSGGFNAFLGILGDAVGFLENIIPKTGQYSKELTNQRNEMDLLARQILLTNEGEEGRAELITELTAKYPEFLKGLDRENVTNEQLAVRLREVNAEYVKRIALATKNEELEAQQTKTADRLLAAEEQRIKVIERLSETQRKFNIQVDETQDLGTQVQQTLEALNSKRNGLGRALDPALDALTRLSKGYEEFRLLTVAFNRESVNSDLLAAEIKALAERLGISLDEAAKELETSGVVVGEGIVEGIKQGLADQKAIDAAILELQKQFELTEFRLKFGVDPEGIDLIGDLNEIDPIPAFGSSVSSSLDTVKEKLIGFTGTYEEFTQGIAQANQQLALDSAAAGLQIFQSITSAITDSAALNSAFLAFEKIATIAQIAINLGKEISTISASAAPTDFLSPDAGLSRKAALISFAKVRAGINIASVIATAIPQFQFEKGTSYGPGAEALVGEKGPERMYVPKGARIYTSEATKKESKLIDALNAGKHEDFIHDHYIRPFAAQMMQRTQEPYNDFQLRQAIKGNKVVKLHPETMRKLAPVKIKRYR